MYVDIDRCLVPPLIELAFSRVWCCCRPEMVVGWYHSHPGFGCWLSGVDINTQQVGPYLHPL